MRRLSLIFMIIAAATSAAIYLLYTDGHFRARERHHSLVTAQASVLLGIELKDPGQAPPDIRSSVERGYHIIMDTPNYLPNNIPVSQLSCTNCHFSEGDTLGGRNNGISLVGVTSKYPHYSQRDKKVISLAQRLNNCFERSMNGIPLEENSEPMKDIINYLHWISSEVEHMHIFPWLGLTAISSSHQPNPNEGEHIYHLKCAPCHGKSGEGSKSAPPVWGNKSFNDGAGMSKLSMLAPFIYYNMPLGDAFLTEEQSLDVASFILRQPRPIFKLKEKT